MKNTPIKTPTSIYTCTNKLEALQIKNAIQRVSAIFVGIEKIDNKIAIIVDEYNAKKACMIVSNSRFAFKPTSEVVAKTNRETSTIEKGIQYVENAVYAIFSPKESIGNTALSI
ncbi:hypothetical protein [Ochrovirga pacifica]|uniref:hypothetical protein n=1 Tax=Ochrovirga pacifica TaxID=1042376 RepID=UPI000255A7F9|nr:hypothetical protein [Ochrovirga pacifica]